MEGTIFWYALGLVVSSVLVWWVVARRRAVSSAGREVLSEMSEEAERVQWNREQQRRYERRVQSTEAMIEHRRRVRKKWNPPRHPQLPAPLSWRDQGWTLSSFRKAGPNRSPWANFTPKELLYEVDAFLAATALYRPVEVLERWVKTGEEPAAGVMPLGYTFSPGRGE